MGGRLTDAGWPPGGDGATVAVVAVLAVVVHLLAGAAHGVTHVLSAVPLAAWQVAVVASCVVVGPLVGTGLVVGGRTHTGGAVIAITLSGAFAFEALAHFVVPNPDHVDAVATGAGGFAATALLGVVTDVVGVLAGLACWRADP